MNKHLAPVVELAAQLRLKRETLEVIPNQRLRLTVEMALRVVEAAVLVDV